MRRSRLNEQLDNGALRRLTAVCAPAGFGKTTLLGEWARERGQAVAWLSLDERDNDIVRFWRYVTQSVIEACPRLADRCSQLLPMLKATAADTFIDALINELYRYPEPIVLAWDDYQFIRLPELHAHAAYFVDNLPEHAHLVIASRSELPLPTVKWAARDELTLLDVRQLQFTLGETADYYGKTTELSVTPSQIAALHKRSEGWVTALQLFSISLQGEPDYDRLIDSFSGGHRFVADYLFQEVFAGLPEQTARFLLHTSMLARLNARICDELLRNNDSEAMLEQLKARNLFLIALDEHNGWFRYHHLFADFLQNRMRRQDEEQWLAANRAASAIFAELGYVVEAIDHAIVSRDAAFAERLLERHAPALLTQGEFATLQRWLDSFPEERTGRLPETSLLHAFVLVVTGHSGRAEELLAGIEQYGRGLPPGERRQQIQSGLLFVKSNLLFTTGKFEQWLSFASGGLDQMLPRDSIYYNFNYNVTEPLVRRTDFGMNGTLTTDTESIARLFTSTLNAHNWNESLINLYVMQSLGEGYYEWNRLDHAAALLPVVDRASRANRTPGLFVPNRIAQSLIHMAQGKPYLAHDAIDEALHKATNERMSPHWKRALHACKIRLCLMEGNVQYAKKLLPLLSVTAKDRPVFSKYYEYVALIRLLGAQRKEIESLRLLSLLKAQAVRENHVVSIVELTIVEACLEEQLGRRTAALVLLEEALAMTEPFGYLRSYLDEGESLGQLLRKYGQLMQSDDAQARRRAVSGEYVTRLLALFPDKPDAAAKPPSAAEELNRTELQLLRLIRQGAANKDIAAKLSLTEGTVKVYLSRIYAKLNVSSRTQALMAAQQLRLLDES
ncbi:LuxR C-terminal-related transcriptional regulator [Paenibacillus arenilitoris]|uniref:LuxR family transcriptional regulator n=1 Tax=Paenibacillus arenilitoris TaxID=2772299 RepID=A0A927CRB8_9BACL|nr:LuxR C-terminal-related transcriptional regulator [Paenibacillus arenilitoris]MBD2872334.1 LuxR family transcriptional regulator [Paenibacillus arenilitoris]